MQFEFARLVCLVVALFVMFASSKAEAADPRYLDELVSHSEALTLAEHRQWSTLLHYRSVIGGYESFVDSPAFFLAPEGKTDPRAELHATLKAFFLPPEDYPPQLNAEIAFDPAKEHPQCRFGARYAWLKEQLKFDQERLPEVKCVEFESWKESIGARSATLIFAGAYVNNPASMFGHTFLRLDRSERGHGSNLTSYAVNYAAQPWSTNPFIYTTLGLTGGFDAYFSVLPFYLQTREYSDFENRELWEYELLFTADELARMVAHIWEIQPYSLDYYYFDENCSFHLLSLMEVARPSLELTRQFLLWAIPADTLRAAIEADDLVGERLHRPSKRSIMMAKRVRLSSAETKHAAKLGQNPNASELKAIASLPVERQAAILEAAHALWTLRDFPEKDTVGWSQQLLVARGALKHISEPITPAPPSPPEIGHATTRVGLYGGLLTDNIPFLQLEFRPALHDLAAPDVGYDEFSQIEFLNTRVRGTLNNDKLEVYLQGLNVINILSLAPFDSWNPAWSWGIDTGLVRIQKDTCPDHGCLAYELDVGFGGSLKLGPLAIYMLLGGEVVAGPVFENWFRVGFGPSAGLRLRMGELMRLVVHTRYPYPVIGENFPRLLPTSWQDMDTGPWSAEAILSIRLSQNFETRLRASAERSTAEAGLSFYWYW